MYVDEFLDLSGCQHPADIKYDFDIGDCGFLELEQFRGLLEMFQLECAFWHIVTLAPFFDSSDVVVNL